MKKIIISLVLLLNSAFVQASFMPVGVQENVAIDTITNDWGWNQIFRSDYSSNESIANAFAGHGKYVMLGAIQDGSSSLALLAAITWEDFITYTAHNVTHTSNGAEWYNNSGSLGFAGLGDSITQNSADTSGVNGHLRLSWHGQQGDNYGSLATNIGFGSGGGWRAGNATSLNDSTAWDKIIFSTDNIDISPVPVPAAAWLFGSALLGFFGFSRKKANA